MELEWLRKPCTSNWFLLAIKKAEFLDTLLNYSVAVSVYDGLL